MFFRIIMKIRIIIWANFPRDVLAIVTGMDTLNQVSRNLFMMKAVYIFRPTTDPKA